MSKPSPSKSPLSCCSSSVRVTTPNTGDAANDDRGSSWVEGTAKYDGEGGKHGHNTIADQHGTADEFDEGQEADDDAVTKAVVPFTKWVHLHVRRMLAAKTPFSYFLIKTISNCRGRRSAASTALFPIPVPFDEIWLRAPQRISREKRIMVARRKLVHIAVMALNYMHSSAPLACLDLLWRRPNSHHLKVYERLGAFVKACDHVETVSIHGVGRKHAKLGARCDEVLGILQRWGQGLRTGYDAGLDGITVPLENNSDELVPYRDLNASRLKLSGRGGWECSPYLDELLVVPFLEPEVLYHPGVPSEGAYPDVLREDRSEVERLARVWDRNGLLRLIPEEDSPEELFRYVRVFNNFKNPTSDRMIIDRRGQNFAESVLHGPSGDLPSGVALLQLSPAMWDEVVVGCITDRRDFYHQFGVTKMRSASNCLYPPFRLSSLRGLDAYDDFVGEFMSKQGKEKGHRSVIGDRLGGEQKRKPLEGDPWVVGCFRAIGQGDHLGVEFATSAHSGLLTSGGLLHEGSRLLARSALRDDMCIEGLVIDDYFSLSRESRLAFDFGKEGTEFARSRSYDCFRRAKMIYQENGILGSDDKDQVNCLLFKAAGAEVDSRLKTVGDGLVAVSSPAAKRLGLASLTAFAAGLHYTSDAFHSSLIGSWVSVLLFRRPAMAVLDQVFKVADSSEIDPTNPTLKRLPRSAADELVVLSALAPVLSSNVAAPYSEFVYATDASNQKGAITWTQVDSGLSKLLWRSADKKGENLPLLTKAQVVLKEYDETFEEHGSELLDGGDDAQDEEETIPRPLGLWYEFIEICGGAGKVSKELLDRGAVVGPVFDLSRSPAYDILDHKVLRWLLHLCEQDRLIAFLVAPPCTSFSPAAFPPVRTYAQPRGLLPLVSKALVGNALAFAAICLLEAGLRLHVFGAGEQPRRSKMRWLKEWERLIELGASETWLASCAYNSPHKKEFVFISVNMDLSSLHRRCPGNHAHVLIQGSYTKPSATYTDELASSIADVYFKHIQERKRHAEVVEVAVAGLEDLLSNDLCLSSKWETEAAWLWKGSSHINLLETSAVLRLFRNRAREGGDQRFVFLCDSNVARSALARGRTSSNAMRPLLRKAAALSIAYGLYPAGRFSPTRMNPADAPSRGKPIPAPVQSSICDLLGLPGLHWLSKKPKLRRCFANWSRLVALLLPDFFRVRWDGDWRRYRASWILPDEFLPRISQFDSTLGFPGEGPLAIFALLGFLLSPAPSSLSWILVLSCPLSCQGARGRPSDPFAISHGDAARQRARSGIELGAGRRVTEATALSRTALVENFQKWLFGNGIDFGLFMQSPPDLDRINALLADYGRYLFKAGKPYYHYSESINGLVTLRPILRRSLQQAWDLAFLWGSYEPHIHHIAVPHQVLISILSVCLIWGWVREAAVFSIAFGALLRIGEVVNATRGDLILPSDVDYSVQFMLLKIREPKTRFRAARHQAGKCESPDLIQVAILGFQRLKNHEKLWPFSSSTLRSRLERVLQRLHLPSRTTDVPKAITLASFRPGGATWLIMMTECSELVQRRGRWASWATMSIYLQEVAAPTYLNDVLPEAKKAVLSGHAIFDEVMQKAITLWNSRVPETAWCYLFQANSMTCKDNVKTGTNGVF